MSSLTTPGLSGLSSPAPVPDLRRSPRRHRGLCAVISGTLNVARHGYVSLLSGTNAISVGTMRR